MSSKLNDIVSNLHDHKIDLSSKKTWIEGEIDEEVASTFSKNISLLDANTNGKPITIVLDSCGGDVTEGLRIYNLILNCNNFVRVIVEGKAESMASIILQAADERVMLEDAHMVIHMGEDGFDSQHPVNARRWVKKADEDNKRIEDIYLKKIKEKKPKYTRNNLKELMLFDRILSPKEAVEMGLADKVLKDDEKSK